MSLFVSEQADLSDQLPYIRPLNPRNNKSVVSEGPLEGKTVQVVEEGGREHIFVLEQLPKGSCPQGGIKICKIAHLPTDESTKVARLVTRPAGNRNITQFVENSNRALERLRGVPGIMRQVACFRTTHSAAAGGGPKYVLYQPYCNGGDLLNGIQRGLTPDQKDWIALQLVRVLRDMHAHGVYHRDLKVENIMIQITYVDDDGNPVPEKDAKHTIIDPFIADFDFAYTKGAGLSGEEDSRALREAMGTPRYVDPDRAALMKEAMRYGVKESDGQQRLSAMSLEELERTDVWAMGLILYALYFETMPASLIPALNSMDRGDYLRGYNELEWLQLLSQIITPTPGNKVEEVICSMLAPDFWNSIPSAEAFSRMNAVLGGPLRDC